MDYTAENPAYSLIQLTLLRQSEDASCDGLDLLIQLTVLNKTELITYLHCILESGNRRYRTDVYDQGKDHGDERSAISQCPYFYLLLRGKLDRVTDSRRQASIVVTFNREWWILSFFKFISLAL
jgi:hypothetical protein